MENKTDIFWQTIFGRRSIRRYQDKPVPADILERVLTAAIWAPNAHNRQPWRFVVVTSPERKQALAAALARRWRQDLINDGVSAQEIEARLLRSRQRLTQPPVLVVGCLTMQDMDAYADAARQTPEWIMAIQSVSLALGNLMLAAHHQGLGSCWVCAPLFAPAAVRSALDLPKDWQPQAIITLGYPAETRASERKPLPEVTLWR